MSTGNKVDWKWEYMEQRFNALAARIPHLLQQFDLSKLGAAEYGGDGPGEPILVAQIRHSSAWRAELAICLKCAVDRYREDAVCESAPRAPTSERPAGAGDVPPTAGVLDRGPNAR